MDPQQQPIMPDPVPQPTPTSPQSAQPAPVTPQPLPTAPLPQPTPLPSDGMAPPIAPEPLPTIPVPNSAPVMDVTAFQPTQPTQPTQPIQPMQATTMPTSPPIDVPAPLAADPAPVGTFEPAVIPGNGAVQPPLPSTVQPGDPAASGGAAQPASAAPKPKIGKLILLVGIVLVLGGITYAAVTYGPTLLGQKPAVTETASDASNAATSDELSTDGATSPEVTVSGTEADSLTQEIVADILAKEVTAGKASSSSIMTVEPVKIVSKTATVTTEAWSVDIGGVKSVYTVTLTIAPGGVPDYSTVKKS